MEGEEKDCARTRTTSENQGEMHKYRPLLPVTHISKSYYSPSKWLKDTFSLFLTFSLLDIHQAEPHARVITEMNNLSKPVVLKLFSWRHT